MYVGVVVFFAFVFAGGGGKHRIPLPTYCNSIYDFTYSIIFHLVKFFLLVADYSLV